MTLADARILVSVGRMDPESFQILAEDAVKSYPNIGLADAKILKEMGLISELEYSQVEDAVFLKADFIVNTTVEKNRQEKSHEATTITMQ